MKVMSFSQQGSRAICILSANGTISNVTLRQPTSSGGTLTYEVRPFFLLLFFENVLLYEGQMHFLKIQHHKLCLVKMAMLKP